MKVLLLRNGGAFAERLESHFRCCPNWEVDLASTQRDVLSLCECRQPDAVLLASTLPLEVVDACHLLRRAGCGVPILVLSEKTSLEDKLKVFSSGADEHVTVPCALDEVAARVVVSCRRNLAAPFPRRKYRSNGPVQDQRGILHWNGVALDLVGQVVTHEGLAIELRPAQFRLLAYLVRNARPVVSKSEIQREVLGISAQGDGSNVRNLVCELRRRLGPAGRVIECARGEGYGVGLRESTEPEVASGSPAPWWMTGGARAVARGSSRASGLRRFRLPSASRQPKGGRATNRSRVVTSHRVRRRADR